MVAISNSLNVNIQLSDKTKDQLRKLKLYWALENLDLPIIQHNLTLSKSEACHLMIPNVRWHELRSVRQRTGHSYSTSIKIAKGFYLRSGNSNSRSYSVDTMTLIDTGSLYLTNKRIIFAGAKKTSSIQLGRIINLSPYANGVEIDKETGKSPTLEIKQHADIFCIMLERLLNER
ncbi:hypothetical protein [Paraflavitalea speifideaquila]|uniref:hypothetical protein n=1 Tax=Paraflavitalea speifideaquila TaxID=3076558 RepID=UPI0028E29CFC|nr:hypothetical protein [Paraflavitalea speifideiaquila]